MRKATNFMKGGPSRNDKCVRKPKKKGTRQRGTRPPPREWPSSLSYLAPWKSHLGKRNS